MQRKTKLMGGIGLIFTLCGIVPHFSFLSIAGIILLLVAYNWLSEEYQEKRIFSNALWAVLLPFFGSILIAIVLAILIASFIVRSEIPSDFLNSLESGNFSILANYLWMIGIILLFWVFFWILVVISGKKWKEADYIIADKTCENLFRTAGNLIYVGSWLIIILIGGLLILAGNIVKTVAFFTAKESQGEQ